MFPQLEALVILVLLVLILVQIVIWPHFGLIISRIGADASGLPAAAPGSAATRWGNPVRAGDALAVG